MFRFSFVPRDAGAIQEDDLFAGLDRALATLSLYGFAFEFESDETLHDGRAQLYWTDAEDRARVTAVRDTDFWYVVVTAGKRGHAKQIEEVLRQHLPIADLEELQEQAKKDLLWHPGSLVRLAIGAGERPDSTTLELLRQGLSHMGPKIRYNAALAAAHTRWSALVPDLERLLKGEPDADVRDAARRALEICQG